MELNKVNKKGFTLIETLVYLALFGAIFTSVISFVITVSGYNNSVEQRNEINIETLFINEHISDSFKKGTTIDTVNSTFNSDNGVLRINVSGGYVEYSIVNSRLNFKSNLVNYYLTDSKFSLSKLNFKKVLDSNNNVVGIKTSIYMSYPKDSKVNKTIDTFYRLP